MVVGNTPPPDYRGGGHSHRSLVLSVKPNKKGYNIIKSHEFQTRLYNFIANRQ